MNSVPQNHKLPFDEYDEMLEEARKAPIDERSRILKDVARLVAKKDSFIVEKIAERVSLYNLATKAVFGQLVRDAKKGSSQKKESPRPPTDDELGDLWLQKYPNTKHGLGEFRRYDNGIWKVIPEDDIKKELLEVLREAKELQIRPSRRLLESVLELVRVRISVPNEQWDADPEKLPMANGVLDISTRTLLPHSPNNYFTNGLGFDYDPSATAPNFLRVLHDAIPDAKYFLQEFAGYSLTPDTRHEIAVWLYGPSGSGKSTILLGLLAMLGNRAGILGLADIERSRFALTNLPGKTLIIATEQPSISFTATHILNAIISGETISIDRKFRDPLEITPRAKIAWAMNSLPEVKDPGNGLFRRIKIIRFPPLEEAKRDPGVKEAVKLEGAGILIWALEGLDRLRQCGYFEIPASVKSATDDFQAENDAPALFVAQMCSVGPDFKIHSGELYDAYSIWCEENGYPSLSMTAIAKHWQRLGFTKYKSGGFIWWRGVDLKD